MKNSDMEKWLRTYPVPDFPEGHMEKLIADGQRYMEGSDFDRTSLWSILLNQVQSFSCSFWIVQAATVIAVSVLTGWLGYLGVPLSYPFTLLAVAVPLLLLFGVREISKSSLYGMWEIEQSSRCQLVKITACRMVIIGMLDLFFLTAILILVSRHFGQSLLRTILYGMVPFNLSCICYLRAIIWSDQKEVSYHLIACMICVSVVFFLLMRQPVVFETSMLGGWLVLYTASVFLLGQTARSYLKHEKKLGELAWNLH